MTHALITRRDAAQATLDRFMDQPFAWGTADCAQMIGWHLQQLGIVTGGEQAGTYSTAIGAKRALARMGVTSLAEQLDRLGFERIAPARALAADIIALPSEGALDAIAIALGNGTIFGFHESAPAATVMRPVAFQAAWRVPV